MAEKDVHVKSYTRDGEKVKEHWRSRPGSGIDDVASLAPEQAVLKGGAEYREIPFNSIMDTVQDIANKGKETWNKIPKPIKTALVRALIQSVLYNPANAASANVISDGQTPQNITVNNDFAPIKLKGGVEFNEYKQKETRENTDNVIKNEKIRHTNIKDNIQSNLPLKNANYTEQKSLSNSNKANTQQYSTEIFKSQLENMYTNAGKKYDIDLRNKEMVLEKAPIFKGNVEHIIMEIIRAKKNIQ